MTQPNDDAPVAAPVPPHKPADDNEEVYFEGSPMLRAELGHMLIHVVIGIALIAAPELLRRAWSAMPWWVYAIGALAGAGVIVWPVIMVRTLRYRISNYRIDYERGLLSKNIDTLELWHVEDIRYHQSLLHRILNVGQITVISHDDTTPKLIISGVPNPRQLFETLKQRVIAVKRQRGVVKMDLGGGMDVAGGDVSTGG
jgi:hypothetical protein